MLAGAPAAEAAEARARSAELVGLVVEGEQDPAVAPAYAYADMAYQLLSSLVAGKSDVDARAAAASARNRH